MSIFPGQTTKTRSLVLLLVSGGVVLSFVAPALAHGELEGTDPEEGSKVAGPPNSVSVTLSEDPADASTLSVLDGCHERVQGPVSVSGADLVLSVGGGSPGTWRARYRAISAEDGHVTRGEFTFTVEGKKDCSGDSGNGNPEPQTQAAPPSPGSDDAGSSSGVFLWLGLGTAVLVALALVLRGRATG